MRVLQVIDSLRIGGAEVLVCSMAPRFLRRGLDCDVLVLSRSYSDLETSLQSAGVKLLDGGAIDLYSPRQTRVLASAMRGYDLVHVHLFPAQLWAVLAARVQPVPALVTTEHNTWNARRRWWLRPLDAWMYPRYQQIACNSEATAESLALWCPRVKGQLRVVSNGIVLDTFANSEAAELSGFGEGKVRAAFVGRFEAQKDHATLLRALRLTPRVHLLLLGDGPLRPQLEKLSRDLGVSDRITFMGVRSDVARVLKACDFYVHATTSDGFGIAACEAMAAGLPVIANDVPGLAQVVQGAGILVPVGDHESLAREMNRVAGSPEKRQQMAEASRRRARDFSIERTVDCYLEMYESVLHRTPRQKVGV